MESTSQRVDETTRQSSDATPTFPEGGEKFAHRVASVLITDMRLFAQHELSDFYSM